MDKRIWLVGILLLTNATKADIYVYEDPQGMMHFAQKRLDQRYRFLMSSPKTGSTKRGFQQWQDQPYRPARSPEAPERLNAMIQASARRHNLDPALLQAVIEAESNFNPKAVSRAGAMGLMQLMPTTAAALGVEDPFDEQANLQAGSRYLRQLLDEFEQLPLALAAYNAGENAVRRFGNTIPPYPETQTYVRRVMNYYYRNRNR